MSAASDPTLFGPETPRMIRGAELSDDGRYRYWLTRDWGATNDIPVAMTFVMLNPSIADHTIDDQTIRRCVGYARRNGYNRLEVVNLYGYRTKDPDELRAAAAAGVDVVGPDNLRYVDIGMRNGRTVVAWGANAATCPATPVMNMLVNWSQPLWCIGVTKDGHPLHPARGAYRDLIRWTPRT